MTNVTNLHHIDDDDDNHDDDNSLHCFHLSPSPLNYRHAHAITKLRNNINP